MRLRITSACFLAFDLSAFFRLRLAAGLRSLLVELSEELDLARLSASRPT